MKSRDEAYVVLVPWANLSNSNTPGGLQKLGISIEVLHIIQIHTRSIE